MKMTIAFNQIQQTHASYAALFLCVAGGFIFLNRVYAGNKAILLWALSASSNAIGFYFWSGRVNMSPSLYYLAGEIFHVAGFFLLVYGGLRFSSNLIRRNVALLIVASWISAWAFSIALTRNDPYLSGVLLKSLRALVFFIGGFLLLRARDKGGSSGIHIAGINLMLWASFVISSIFIQYDNFLYFGFLIGFHMLSYFGMVAMIVDGIKAKAERLEERVTTLEGILPICSYCKKIRDERNDWKRLEEYIEDRSAAEFSHGICPECFAKHRPDVDKA